MTLPYDRPPFNILPWCNVLVKKGVEVKPCMLTVVFICITVGDPVIKRVLLGSFNQFSLTTFLCLS